MTFEVGDGKIEFILEKLLKNPSLRDSCCLVDLLSDCVQENPLEPPLTAKLEERLPDDTEVEKIDAQDKGFEGALGENSIPTNQGNDVSFKEDGKSKDNKARLRPNKNESKVEKKVKEKVHEKLDQKYEPPHRKGRRE